MDDESQVRTVNDAFYAAFEALDYTAMAACWSQRATDVCVHPGWTPLHGWPRIRDAWRTIFANTNYMRVRPADIRIRVEGGLAFLTCVEELFSVADAVTVQGAVACTHVFERIDGAWKLVLHHGSPIAATQQPAPGGGALN